MLVGVILSLGSALGSAGGYVSIKRGLENVDYQLFILSSVLIGSFLSGCLLWIMGTGFHGLTIIGSLPFVITGIFGGGLLVRVALSLSTETIGASETHAFVSASPLVTVFVEAVILQETISVQASLGTLSIVFGASLLSYFSRGKGTQLFETAHRIDYKDLIFPAYAIVMVGIQPILQQAGLEPGTTPLQGLFIRFISGGAVYTLYRILSTRKIQRIRKEQIGFFVLASLCWFISPLLIIYALQYLSASIVASLTRVGPLFTVILTHLYLKGIENVNLKKLSPSLLIILGAILISTG